MLYFFSEVSRLGSAALAGGIAGVIVSCEETASFQKRSHILSAKDILAKYMPCDYGLLVHAPLQSFSGLSEIARDTAGLVIDFDGMVCDQNEYSLHFPTISSRPQYLLHFIF